MFIFYNVIASSASIKTLINKRETLLLMILLSRRAVRDLTDLMSRIIMKKMSK